MTIGQVGGAGPTPSPTPNIVTQVHAGAAGDTNGQVVSDKNMSKRNLDLFNAASKWSKPEGTQAELADMEKVKIAEKSVHIDDWDEAIDTNPGEVPLQTLTGILRKLFDNAFANKCKKLLLVSDKGQILMTRRGLGAEMYAHIEGEENYKKEMHLSIDDNLTLSVLRALYRDNTVQKFLPLNGAVGRKPAAADMPDDTDASDYIGSRRGSGPGYESGSESESEIDSGAIFSNVLCYRFTSPDAILCHRLANERGVDVSADHIQNDASGFDKDIFDRDAGLTEERNLVHSDSGSLEQITPEQILSAAANELRIDMSSPVKASDDSDSENESFISVDLLITPENVKTTTTTMNSGVASKVTGLPSPSPSPSSSPAPAVISSDNQVRDVSDVRYRKNLAAFDARPKTEIDYEKGLPIPNEATEVTHL
jgi:hypothetical protein